MNRLFRNNKKTTYAIVIFVLAILLLFAINDRADASELYLDAGSTIVRGETPVLGLSVKWPGGGPANTDWEAGFRLSGESSHYRDNPNAITIYGMIVDGYKWFEMGLGFAYNNVDWEYTCRETFNLMAGVKRKRFTLRYSHNSSAGSCKPNAGRDFLTVGYRF